MLKWRPLSWSGSARTRLNLLIRSDGNTVANYRAGIGQTDDGAGLCSSWANQTGAAGALTAATTARPTIQADGSLLFDGTANFMSASFTLIQPETVYFVGKQITWTSNDSIFDGSGTNTMRVYDSGAVSPEISANAGSTFGAQNWTINTTGVLTAIYNGASSSLQLNGSAVVSGASGAANGSGFFLGADAGGGTPTRFSNIQAYEVIIRKVADSAATQALIQGYLRNLYRTP